MDPNIELENNTSKYLRLWHNIIQGTITIVVVSMICYINIRRPTVAYNSGLENGVGEYSNEMIMTTWHIFNVIGKLLFVQMMILLGVIVIKIIKQKIKVKIGYKPAILLTISLVSGVSWLFVGVPNIPYFTKGLCDRMKSDVNVREIQEWLRNRPPPNGLKEYAFDPKPRAPDYYGEGIEVITTLDSNQWPATICSLNPAPEIIYVNSYKAQQSKIRLEWNWIDARWGIEIGPPEMEIEETKDTSKLKRGDEYRLILAPGAYVWHDVR